MSDKNGTIPKGCTDIIFNANAFESFKFIGFLAIFVIRSLVHHLLKPLAQPHLTSDFVLGMLFGNIGVIRKAFSGAYSITLNNVVEFGMICHMFVLGLEMNPYLIVRRPTVDVLVAYSGMVSTFILAAATTPFLSYTDNKALYFSLALSIMAAGNGSPILTRLVTNLKIRKSDIGKLATTAGVHSDMVSTLIYCIGFIAFPSKVLPEPRKRIMDAVWMTCSVVIQILFTAKLSPYFLNWVNNENPEGKPLKGSHLVMSLAFMVLICSGPSWYEYSPALSAFTAGLFLPNQGRMSKWIINKINYLLNTVFYPVLFFWVGFMVNVQKFDPNWMTLAQFASLLGSVIAGKVIGTVLCGLLLGYQMPETAELGLLLTAKGHFHMFLATTAIRDKVVSNATGTMIVIVIVITVAYTPFILMDIIKRARKRVPVHVMALQWLDPSSELRLLMGLIGPHNIPSTTTLMEISRGGSEPGTVFYATDMIELTDEIAATMRVEGKRDAATVTDQAVTEMRDAMTAELREYAERKWGGARGGVTIKRMLALATFGTMAQDLCSLAEDLMVSMIILPFHKRQNPNGTLDAGSPGFRYVNRKVLKLAPCSVGILVDRSFGKNEEISRSQPSIDVAVIFMGGRDDREALAFAGRVARHPGVKLKVIRFLFDKSSQSAECRRLSIIRTSAAEQEEEMRLDDECFAEFYERHVAGGQVSYAEKHLVDSRETFKTLQSLEADRYSLIIVGRGGRANTILTVGLNDWQQCPELGSIGDVLAGPDFLTSTSILVVQQQRTRGQLEGLDEDFCIL